MVVLHCTRHKPRNFNRFFRCRTRDNVLILNHRKTKRSLSFEKVKDTRLYEEHESKWKVDELKCGSRTLTSENRDSVMWTLSRWRESARCKRRNKRRKEATWIELICHNRNSHTRLNDYEDYETLKDLVGRRHYIIRVSSHISIWK